MSTTSNPVPVRDSDEDDTLIRALDALSIKNKKLIKATTHEAPADPRITVRSWKMDEFKYGVHPSPFPTLARGLFTREIIQGKKDAQVEEDVARENFIDRQTQRRHVIVARGYDKFFNIGEVPWNSWPSIEKYTQGPYYITLKSNGCIIFIAALSPAQVVVTSKHSIGSRGDGMTSHAAMGEQWLYKHLAAKGRTIAELATRLQRENITAVAELCDDSFEEHVLGYPPELTGLHLHGLNKNAAAFSTKPPSVVDAFADEFGFIKTATFTLNTAAEVRKFTDEVGESGKWRGEAVEGFVVRCKVTNASSAQDDDEASTPKPSDNKRQRGESSKNTALMHPPYPPGSDYFFKVKFDEPYLMYRAWREITKTILSAKSKTSYEPSDPISIPKSRLARTENKLYREWVEREIDLHKEDFEEFLKGKGIIETRERFLKWFETKEGQARFAELGGAETSHTGTSTPLGTAVAGAAEDERREKLRAERDTQKGKLVIVPIAVPGCGKTSVAVALTHLFPSFGHTQSDDVKAKKTAPTFQRNITELLKSHNVVIADRNNHLAQHRQGIREAAGAAISKLAGSPYHPIRLIALNWSLNNLPLSTIHRHCSTRIIARGENHQSLRPSPKISHEDIIWQFISSAEELGDGEVEAAIEMDVAADSLESAVTVAIEGLLPLLSKWVDPPPGTDEWRMPSSAQIEEACNSARGYQVTVRKEDGSGGKPTMVRYFAFLPEIDLAAVVEDQVDALSTNGGDSVDVQKFWTLVKSEGRLTRRPHITIVHKQSLPAEQSIWDACIALDAVKVAPALFEFTMGTLLCDGDVMSIAVDGLRRLPPAPSATGCKPDGDEANFQNAQIVATKAADALLAIIPDSSKLRLHITVGTKNDDIRPIEGGKLVERWKSGASNIAAISLAQQRVVGRVRGLAG